MDDLIGFDEVEKRNLERTLATGAGRSGHRAHVHATLNECWRELLPSAGYYQPRPDLWLARVATCMKVFGRFDVAEQCLDEALAIDPFQPVIGQRRVILLRQMGAQIDALAQSQLTDRLAVKQDVNWEAVERVVPKDLIAITAEDSGFKHVEARAYLIDDNNFTAEHEIDRVIAKAELNRLAAKRMAELLHIGAKFEHPDAHIRKGIAGGMLRRSSQITFDALDHVERGHIYELAGMDPLRAQLAYQEAVSVEPTNAYAHRKLADFYGRHGMWKEETRAQIDAYGQVADADAVWMSLDIPLRRTKPMPLPELRERCRL